jgi:hypothetical protein
VHTVVNLDATGRKQLNLLKIYVPLAAAVVGIAALIAGILLARRRPGDQPEEAEPEETEPAPEPQGLELLTHPAQDHQQVPREELPQHRHP